MGLVIAPEAFRDTPTLTGDRVRLEPLTPSVLEEYLQGLNDPTLKRLTGTHATFDRAGVAAWLGSRQAQHGRADWAIVLRADGTFLGEAVLNHLDFANASANYRIWLATHVCGRGYGTEATQLVVAYALDTIGLHRLGLDVYDFNERARRVYAKCGFTVEGRRRGTLLWDGQWHDELVMSVLQGDPRPRTGGRG